MLLKFRADVGLVGRQGSGCRQRRGVQFDPVEDRSEPAVALRQLRLPFKKLADLGFHQLLVEHLAAGDAVDLRAQRRDAVFVGLL